MTPADSFEHTGKKRTRLDRLLVDRGLAGSREKARAMIMAGLVHVDGARLDKPGHSVPDGAVISLKESHPLYVSRGGEKLEAALDQFPVSVQSLTLLDVGASTGGFTDCLLKRGAGRVIAIDVGYGQLDWTLRQDPRVELVEKANIRYLKPQHLQALAHGAVIDVSFISLRLVIPPVSHLLVDDAFIIALIKPQFEVGKGKVGKGGVVRDPILHQEVIEELTRFFEHSGWQVQGCIPSPLLGPKGNREFLVYMTRG
ncbi:MAG: TlyA family methyltransferase [Thermodesulfobacteriota bacterium]|nr:TlyA family methyltransferase [Thermodesulfobacteriota bacterium]